MAWKGLVPWKRDEESPLVSLQKEINRTFEDFFKGFPFESSEVALRSFSPAVDVAETDKELVIHAELPGLDEKDIEVSVEGDNVILRGEKKAEKEEKKKDYYHVERSYGTFQRVIPLPVKVNKDKAEAKYKDGVLTITFPKTEEALKDTKKITVTKG